MSGRAQVFERGYRSMADENAVSSDNPSLPEALEVVADVSNWSVSETLRVMDEGWMYDDLRGCVLMATAEL